MTHHDSRPSVCSARRHDAAVRSLASERGTALFITLMATMLLTALGVGLVLTTITETMITANYRSAQEVLYAADAGLERSIQDLLKESNWTGVLSGAIKSGFIDNASATLPDGSPANLAGLTTSLQAQADTVYGTDLNRPVWRLYSHAPLSELLPGGVVDAQTYVVVWVSDDPAEVDNDPTRDTNGIAFLHAEAFGENGSRKIVEATIFKSSATGPESGYVGQRGQDEQGDNLVNATDVTTVKEVNGRETAAFVSDRHLSFGANATLEVFGDPVDFNNGVGQLAARLLSWREVR